MLKCMTATSLAVVGGTPATRFDNEQLRRIMERRKLTCRAVAAMTGLHYATISRARAGSQPTLAVAERIATGLGLELVDLIVKDAA